MRLPHRPSGIMCPTFIELDVVLINNSGVHHYDMLQKFFGRPLVINKGFVSHNLTSISSGYAVTFE